VARNTSDNRSVRQLDLPSDDETDMMSVFGALWRGKGVILVCAACAVVLAGWYAFVQAVPTYRAVAQMSLQVRNEAVITIDSVLSGGNPDQSSINTQMEVLRSRELLGRLVDRLGLTGDPEFNPALADPDLQQRAERIALYLLRQPQPEPATAEAVRNIVIDRLRTAIATAARDRSYVFTISVTTRDPQKSALIANALAETYRQDQIAFKVNATQTAATWLAERIAELQIEIEEAESRINVLRSRNTLISDAAISALDTQSVAVTARLQDAELLLDRVRSRVAAFGGLEATDLAGRAQVSGDAQLLALLTTAADGDQAARLRFDRRFDQLLLQLRGEVSRTSEVVDDLRRQADTITARFERMSRALIEIEQIERDTEATRILYETFLGRLKEATVQAGVHQADSRLLSEATPGVKVTPRRAIILGMALFAGVVVGAILVLVREAMQNTFRTAADLEQETGFAVLGQIPRVPARSRPAIIEYLATKPSSAASEAVRNLRTSILMFRNDRPCQVILVTSSIPGEGKTTLSIALARNFAGLENTKVLLIEGDIRRRKFTDYFPEAKSKAGLLSVILGKVPLREAVWTHPVGGIDVLMSEASPINAADIMSSEGFRGLLGDMRGQYDYIIVDTPPVLVVPDARVMSPLVDAIVYVVQWDKTTRSMVREGLKQFDMVNIPVTGLVLSQINLRSMRRHGKDHGAYASYGKDYYEL
jgi:succinoglycan biosynthesis transport protein ExoP